MTPTVQMDASPLCGAVLAGGMSRRMGAPKEFLRVGEQTFIEYALNLLDRFCAESCISVGPEGLRWPDLPGHRIIGDKKAHAGPLGGIYSVLSEGRDTAWLILAVDMPFLSPDDLECLVAARAPGCSATAFGSAEAPGYEPLCTIWEPSAMETVEEHLFSGRRSVTRCLGLLNVLPVERPRSRGLFNVNTPQDLAVFKGVHSER